MKKTKLLATCLLCITAIMVLTGCNILDSLIKEGGSQAPLGQILNRNTEVGQDALPVVTTPQGEQTVKLYFADKEGRVLIEQSRTIPKTLSLARETVKQWIMGPTSDSGCYPVVSPQTLLLGININNGIATVDLSKEYLQPFSNVTAEAALYGLVNTVAQFSTVQLVKIRIEGQEIRTYRGINLDQLRFRNDVIGYSSGSVSANVSAEEKKKGEDNAREADNLPSPSSQNLFRN